MYIEDKVIGNCIDRFNELTLEGKLKDIEQLRDNIKKRKENRDKCFETDFHDILEIKNISLKIFENCSKFLEHLTDVEQIL